MAGRVVKLIFILANGEKWGQTELGRLPSTTNAEIQKPEAVELVRGKVDNLFNENVRRSCAENLDYEITEDGDHQFTCKIPETTNRGGKRGLKSKKTKKRKTKSLKKKRKQTKKRKTRRN